MKVIDPGHMYELDNLDAGPANPTSRLKFVKREGDKYPGNVGHYAGTNIQEVLRALIDRVKYLDGQEPCMENSEIIFYLRESIARLEERAAKRHGRTLAMRPCGLFPIEVMPTCPKCGHIECEGTCH